MSGRFTIPRERRPAGVDLPTWKARRAAIRLLQSCFNRYGVSTFDGPTLAVLYPLHAAIRRNVGAEIRKRPDAAILRTFPVGE